MFPLHKMELMKKIKKIGLSILVIGLLFTITACGTKQEEKDNKENDIGNTTDIDHEAQIYCY